MLNSSFLDLFTIQILNIMQLQIRLFYILFFFSISYALTAQDKEQDKTPFETALEGFEFRSVGPAFMSGRIADIAIDPNNESIWYET